MANGIKWFLGTISGRKRYQRSFTSAFLLAVTLSAAMACYWATAARAREQFALANALSVSAQLELLATLHIDANADFLTGVGTARFGSNAWPVARTVTVTRSYDFLEQSFAGDSTSQYEVTALRAHTAVLASQLENAANDVARTGHARMVDAGRLEAANITLQAIMHALSRLQLAQSAKLAAMQSKAETQLAWQRMTFAVALALGLCCLGYVLRFAHKASLARSAANIVARQAHDRFIEYFEQHPLAMLIFDIETGFIQTANAAAQRQYGGNLENLRAVTIDQLRPINEIEPFRHDLRSYLRSGSKSGWGGVRHHTCLDGRSIHVDVSYHFLEYAGRPACFITAADVSEREAARAELRFHSSALEASPNAVLITEAQQSLKQSRVVYANPAFETLTGLSVHEVMGQLADTTLSSVFGDESACDNDLATVVSGRRRDGTVFWAQRHVSPVMDTRGVATHAVTVFSDISDRMRDQQRLSWLACFDSLTHLPNRATLQSRLGELLEGASCRADRVAAVFIDLDNFKEINDSLGHAAGDEVIREVARRLSTALCEPEMVARFAGDEFVALLCGPDIDQLVDRARDLHRLVIGEMRIGQDIVASRASAGVAVFPDDATNADDLIRYADAAMYEAKRQRDGSLRVFNRSIAVDHAERHHLTQRLQHALKSGQLRVAYQPRVEAAGSKTVAFEALLRWSDSERGDISPATFIPLAEERGLIVPIGEWVLRTACEQAKEWARVQPDIVVSINVSPLQFSRSDFPKTLRQTLRAVGVDPRNIELEITESVVVTPAALTALHEIRRLGVSIAIDDFGTGFSSLAYIRDFKADCVKIDMSFVHGIGKSTNDEVIVRAVIAMAHTLDMRVVAEGVETAAQFEFLASHQCDQVQGYLFAPPMSAVQAGHALSFANDLSRLHIEKALEFGDT
ncbi:putative bifunctional diguanylate cyclase/phosphodiesterase [Caballeronia sp. RCC_10]|uniref:putative bifunctional diguanylate cyclase/phosphodiesterase n=1 Tax=Caballeronia sp. RCC_10 TaxID=3239227 RepID=UPI00352582E8